MRGNFGLKLQNSLAYMLDFIVHVMQMSRVNREKGYWKIKERTKEGVLHRHHLVTLTEGGNQSLLMRSVESTGLTTWGTISFPGPSLWVTWAMGTKIVRATDWIKDTDVF